MERIPMAWSAEPKRVVLGKVRPSFIYQCVLLRDDDHFTRREETKDTKDDGSNETSANSRGEKNPWCDSLDIIELRDKRKWDDTNLSRRNEHKKRKNSCNDAKSSSSDNENTYNLSVC